MTHMVEEADRPASETAMIWVSTSAIAVLLGALAAVLLHGKGCLS